MQSDTAKAKQAVLDYLQVQQQATTAELNTVIARVLGASFTEGKAAGAIRMCVEDAASGISRLDRGVYQYRPQAEPEQICGTQTQQRETFAQKEAIDRVMEEALQLAKAHISTHLDIYALDAQAFAYVSQKLLRLNQAVED